MKYWTKMFLNVTILAIGIIIGLCFYMGVFLTLEAKEGELKPAHAFFYKEFQMDYKDIGEVWPTIEEYLEKGPHEKFARCAGLYFDAPEWAIHSNESRSAIGYLVPANKSGEFKKHLKEGLKEVMLPQVKTIETKFPFRNMYSFLLGARKSLPVIFEKAKEFPETIQDKGHVPFIEIVEDKYIRYAFPVGSQRKNYVISTFPITKLSPLGIQKWEEYKQQALQLNKNHNK